MQAALRLGRLVAVLLTGLANFQSQVSLCSNLVENVALGQVYPKYFQFPLSTTFYQCSRIIYSSLKETNIILTTDLDINPLTPNDPYSGRTAPLTSKRCTLYIYSTNIGA